jgi:nicotinate phosphoribosyltransferase
VTGSFHVASPEEIRFGAVADVALHSGGKVMEAEGANPRVVAEVRAERLPREWMWAAFAGLEEAVSLLEGRAVTVEALGEGSVFYAEEPVLVLSGPYREFHLLETALLGLVCHASGVATTSARFRLAAGERPVHSYAARWLHPAIAPMVERAVYIGGCDGVTTMAGHLGKRALDTMTHGEPLILGEERAWQGPDGSGPKDGLRVALVGTSRDERSGALAAAQALRDRLGAIRVESRSGDVSRLLPTLREIRWELDARGFGRVQLFVTGALEEQDLLLLNRYADVYGVGVTMADAPVVDFALDIVEIDGQPRSRRGKLSGRKHLWACTECGNRGIAPAAARLGHCPRCGRRVRSLLDTWLAGGRRRRRAPAAREVRDHCAEQIRAAPNPFAQPT